MIKVFTVNKNGKIELTEKELKKLLDDVYWEGYRDNNKTWTWSTPLTYPYYQYANDITTATSTASTATINAANVTSADFAPNTVTINKNASGIIIGKE